MKCHDCPVSPPLTCLGESHTRICGQLHDPGRPEQLRALAEGREYVPPPYVVPRESFPPGPDPADWVPSGEAPPHAPPPTFADKAASFIGAVVQHAAAGFPHVNEAERERRLGICRACEHFDEGRCRLCSCIMRIKASWLGQKCPHDPPKW